MERPILFNSDMVLAILNGTKTQTRRIIDNNYKNANIEWFTNKYGTRLVYKQNDVPEPVKNADGTTSHKLIAMEEIKKPYEVGDILWVRETWLAHSRGLNTLAIKYKADSGINERVSFTKERFNKFYKYADQERWQPSLFMPREAARILLKVTGVRAERLHEISEVDARAEGASKATYDSYTEKYSHSDETDTYKDGFHEVWDTCYNWPKCWLNNPWVWVVEFEMIKA